MKKIFQSIMAIVVTLGLSFSFVKADPPERDPSAKNISIAIVCDDPNVAQQYIGLVCQHDYVREAWHDYDLNIDSHDRPLRYSDPDKGICYVNSMEKSCYVHFKFLTPSDLNEYNPSVRKNMSECEGVVIIYNIADRSLGELWRDSKKYSSSLDFIERFDTPLCNVMRYVKHMFYDKGETMPFEFLTYNKDECKDDYEERRDKLNTFTCYSEPYFGSDNTWQRNHPDISDPVSYGHMASWACRWAANGRRSWSLSFRRVAPIAEGEGSPSKKKSGRYDERDPIFASTNRSYDKCAIAIAGVCVAIVIGGVIIYVCCK